MYAWAFRRVLPASWSDLLILCMPTCLVGFALCCSVVSSSSSFVLLSFGLSADVSSRAIANPVFRTVCRTLCGGLGVFLNKTKTRWLLLLLLLLSWVRRFPCLDRWPLVRPKGFSVSWDRVFSGL